MKTMREYHETVSILENELDANDYQTIMDARTHGRSSDEHYPRYRNGDMWNQ